MEAFSSVCKIRPFFQSHTCAFRTALKNTKNLTVPQGVINMSPSDHVGPDQRSRVMGRILVDKFTCAHGG